MLLKSEHLSNAKVARKTGCGSSISIQLDKKILGKWNIRIENEARAGSQAHNGLFGRGIGTGSCVTGTPECEIGQVHVGKSLRQEGKRYHLQRFLEVLAQDISVSPDAQG